MDSFTSKIYSVIDLAVPIVLIGTVMIFGISAAVVALNLPNNMDKKKSEDSESLANGEAEVQAMYKIHQSRR